MEKLKLTIELVPSTSWYSNVRSNVTVEEWDDIRQKCYERAGKKCEICGATGFDQMVNHAVECHEIWDYDMDSEKAKRDGVGFQKLVGFIALCPYCHKVKHFGHTESIGQRDLATQHLINVNQITEREAWDYVAESFEDWRRRSGVSWKVDISYLDEYHKL